MENAKKHWPILKKLGLDLRNKVREFLVIGQDGYGAIVATEDGLGYWIGEMRFGPWDYFRTASIPTLLNVPGLVSMAQGDSHILLLNKRGEIYSMGKNYFKQLGLGTWDLDHDLIHFPPQLIPSTYKFTSVRCGGKHSLALTEDGKVCAWGGNDDGQVGVLSSTHSILSPHQIPKLDLHQIVAVECGRCHSLALTDQGIVYGWGNNAYRQLGDWLNASSPHTPTRIPTPSPVQSMAAGDTHTLLLTQTGEVYSCGFNGYGHLDLSTTSPQLSKVAGLPLISQIASHPLAQFSIAMSPDHRCFVWGLLANGTSQSTPRELPPIYSTVESPLSYFKLHSTPHSVVVPGREYSFRTDSTTQLPESNPESVPNQTPTYDIIDKMFNNPEHDPDIRFLVGNQTILAHQSVLQSFSAHFYQLFSSSSSANLNLPPSSVTLQSGPSTSRHTTNPFKPDSTPHSSQVTISIPDYSYPVFYAYIRFIYMGNFEVSPEHLANIFSLSVAYLESNLQQFCLSRMRTTLSPTTCCLYYPLTHRHSLPELSAFQQDLVQFISTRTFEVYRTAAYLSMDAELCKKLAISISNIPNNLGPTQFAIPGLSQKSPTSKRLRTNSF